MKLSGMIAALIASGGTAEQIQAVVQAAEAEQDAIDAARREKAAQKKRAQRAVAEMSPGHAGTDGDASGQSGTDRDKSGQPSLPPEKEPPTPQEKLTPHTPVNPRHPSDGAPKGASPRGTALPSNWSPTEKHYALADELGRDGAFVDDLAGRMREWAGANRNRAIARKADWDLTFNGFLRREHAKTARRVNGARAGPRDPDKIVDTTVNAAARYLELHS